MKKTLDFIQWYNKTTRRVAEDGKDRKYNQNFEYEIESNKRILIIKTDNK